VSLPDRQTVFIGAIPGLSRGATADWDFPGNLRAAADELGLRFPGFASRFGGPFVLAPPNSGFL